MLQELNNKLISEFTGEKTIFVLKGFNACVKRLKIDFDRIFDLNLEENLLKIGQTELQRMLLEFQKLTTNKNFWCLYEEIVFIEKNNLIGVVAANNYKLKIIDIGCFDYLYPGFYLKMQKNILMCIITTC